MQLTKSFTIVEMLSLLGFLQIFIHCFIFLKLYVFCAKHLKNVVLGVASFKVCIILVLVKFGFLRRIEFGSTLNIRGGYAYGNTWKMLGIHGIDFIVQDCSIPKRTFAFAKQLFQLKPIGLDIVKDPTTIEAYMLDTRFEARSVRMVMKLLCPNVGDVTIGMKSFQVRSSKPMFVKVVQLLK